MISYRKKIKESQRKKKANEIEIDDLKRKISDLERKISDLESEIDDLKSEIDDLKSEIDDLKRKEDSESSTAQIATLRADMISKQNLITAYLRNIEMLLRNIETLKNIDIKFLQECIVSLGNQILEFHATLKKMEKMPNILAPSRYNSWPTTIDKLVSHQKIFYDPHALAMYDALSALEADGIVQDGILSNMQGYLDKDKHSEYFDKVLKENSDFDEQTFSAMVAVHLDNYLQSQHFDDVKAFHQLPSRDSEAPDIYVFQTNKEGFPEFPLLISDVKLTDFEGACDTTHAYVCTLNTIYKSCFPKQVLLGLAGTPSEYVLYLYRTCNAHIHPIELRKFHPSEFKLLLPSICACISKILHLTELPPQTDPVKCLIDCCDGEHTKLHGLDVAHCIKSGMVNKYYDKQNDPQADKNFYVMCKLLNYKEDLQLSLEPLSRDGRFFRTRCKYLDQNNWQSCNEAQRKALELALEKLHDCGYVHGDIRRSNILLDNVKNTAYLIDFDLCGKEGTAYPSNYNHQHIEERHRDARKDLPRRKEHDTFALNAALQLIN